MQARLEGFCLKQWLKDAVFYEIYPQSFYDTNGDGIGDIPGITAKLDYIRDLGCNALWINPCFDSPFKDAGYDVRDYKKVAPRYGTNEDLAALFAAAHARNMHVLLDLVPGHTSEEHPWFVASSQVEKNEYSGRYIWTDHCFASADGMPFIGGETPRSGTYVLNFFKCQPALNYGYGKIHEPWQKPTDHPDCRATIEAMKDVMRFWLGLGCDGFRVDMAASLVKNDTRHKKYTCAIWREIADMLDREYPQAAMISEWNAPRLALKNGFDMDFMLNGTHNGYDWLMRCYDGTMDSRPHNIGKAYFCRDSGTGIDKFLDDWLPSYKATRKDGLYCLLTCNHDTIRPAVGLTTDELRIAYAMLFTMPGAPFLYYGDEIGMRYLTLPTKEGGYFRTGSRTPMQWAPGENLGFTPLPWRPSRPTPAACGIPLNRCWLSAMPTGNWIPTRRSRCCLPPRQKGTTVPLPGSAGGWSVRSTRQGPRRNCPLSWKRGPGHTSKSVRPRSAVIRWCWGLRVTRSWRNGSPRQGR